MRVLFRLSTRPRRPSEDVLPGCARLRQMGRNNKQRRAANKRRRQQRARRPSGPAPRRPPDGQPDERSRRTSVPGPEELIRAAAGAWGVDGARFATLQTALVDRLPASASAADALLDAAIDQLWRRGWTPTDLVHVIARQLTGRHVEVVAARVVLDGRRRRERGQALHPRWSEQLAGLEERGAAAGSLSPEERLRWIVELLCVVTGLPAVPRTVPAPGQAWAGSASGTGHLDAAVLERVRALLAKAESTEFEAEGEAFTAKAQELIARHAIDEALLHTVEDVGEPAVRRIPVDDPYADAKACLIGEVADANRCRVVHSPGLGWVTVFGYDHDLDAIELLAASLLAQATAAMVRHGSRRDASGRSRTRSFRRAFLLGFAQRIGERLRQATEAQMAATEDVEGRLLPVLAARDDRVEAAEAAAFPEVVRHTTSASNATGWHAGRAAAEVANLEVPAGRLPAS